MIYDDYAYFLTITGPIPAIIAAGTALDKQMQTAGFSLQDLFEADNYDFDEMEGKGTIDLCLKNGSTPEIIDLVDIISNTISNTAFPNLTISLDQENLDHQEDSSVHLWQDGVHHERHAILIYPTFDTRNSTHKIFDALEAESGHHTDGTKAPPSKVELLERLVSSATPHPSLSAEKGSDRSTLDARIAAAQKQAMQSAGDSTSSKENKQHTPER